MSEPNGPPNGLGGHHEETMTLAGLSRNPGIPERTLQLWQARYGVPAPLEEGDGARYAWRQAHILNHIRQRLDEGVAEADAVSQGLRSMGERLG